MYTREMFKHERPVIQAFYLGMDSESRYTRWTSTMTDEAVSRYVQTRDNRTRWFGAFDSRGQLIGVGEGFFDRKTKSVEAAYVVHDSMRGCGVGYALALRIRDDAKAYGMTQMTLLCLASNKAMVKLARKMDMSLDIEFGEAHATADLSNIRLQESLDHPVAVMVERLNYWWASAGKAIAQTVAPV